MGRGSYCNTIPEHCIERQGCKLPGILAVTDAKKSRQTPSTCRIQSSCEPHHPSPSHPGMVCSAFLWSHSQLEGSVNSKYWGWNPVLFFYSKHCIPSNRTSYYWQNKTRNNLKQRMKLKEESAKAGMQLKIKETEL